MKLCGRCTDRRALEAESGITTSRVSKIVRSTHICDIITSAGVIAMRMLAATTALISIAGFVSAAAQPPASGGGRPAAYAGCLVQSADGGFELAHAVPAVK